MHVLTLHSFSLRSISRTLPPQELGSSPGSVHHLHGHRLRRCFRDRPALHRRAPPWRPGVLTLRASTDNDSAGPRHYFLMDPAKATGQARNLARGRLRSRDRSTRLGLHRSCEHRLRIQGTSSLRSFDISLTQTEMRWEFYMQLLITNISGTLVNNAFRVTFSEMLPPGLEVRWFGMQLVLSCATVSSSHPSTTRMVSLMISTSDLGQLRRQWTPARRNPSTQVSSSTQLGVLHHCACH